MKHKETKPSLQKDMYYATLFNQITRESTWLHNMSFAPGGWAVDYCYLYIMYRALNALRYKVGIQHACLDLGLGQTSHMLIQYANLTPASLRVIEHDADWIDFYRSQSNMDNISNYIMELGLIKQHVEVNTNAGTVDLGEVNDYQNFISEGLGYNIHSNNNTKYSFISVDAPFGTSPYSRIHILQLIELNMLDDSFVIMIDDTEREGEKNTIKLIKQMLNERGIKYSSTLYSGEKQHCIITSSDLKFLTSL